MGCGSDISNTCADSTLTTCVDYEGLLGANTKIIKDCVNQSDVNEDLYIITDEIIDGLDISLLESTCITIPKDATIADIIILYEEKICEIEGKVTEIEDTNYSTLDVTGWGLTIPACIADPCASPPTTLGPLLQAIMDNRNCT